MLQVAVDDGGAVPVGLGQTGENGSLFPEVAGKADAPYMDIPLGLGLDTGPGVVSGAIIHKQQLIGNVLLGQSAADGLNRQRNVGFFVIGRNDNG